MKAFSEVKIGDITRDYFGEGGKVVMKGTLLELYKKYGSPMSWNELEDLGLGKQTEGIAVKDEDGLLVVYVYGGEGAYVI